jgi:hypothetical protein
MRKTTLHYGKTTGWAIRPDSGKGFALTDPDHWRYVRAVRDVGHDFLCVRSEARLEALDGIAEDLAHADVGRGRARSAAGQTLVSFLDGRLSADGKSIVHDNRKLTQLFNMGGARDV